MELRADHVGEHRTAYEKNRRRIYATQDTCGICGRPVDFTLRYPHPLSPCIDHIVPISKGGHPSDISNLQLAHFTCNRAKADKLANENTETNKYIKTDGAVSNRNLPLTFDWKNF